ncbi:MAG: glycosyltransferase family 4 protein [Verrucomicrobiaceae bacterium]|nr:glycosyltransferase family 4 protein [Verrucomicrobiaceae bacterium]
MPTGFATVTHNILAHLHRRWDAAVSGVNYDGAAHPFPYRIFPAWQGGDMWGMDRFAHVCAEFAPDAVVINNDWWNVAGFLERAPRGVPVIGYMPVDGTNMSRDITPKLDGLSAAVWYTGFGREQARLAGFRGRDHVVPHGIDTTIFRPVDRALARETLGLPADSFIVGNVNRNQPRKRLDVTIRYFAEWIARRRVRDAFLLLHCARQDTGWDLAALAAHHGVADRVIFTGGEKMRDATDKGFMPLVYSALDVQVSTTLGEGWGLTTMEGMACGVPQIVPDWAALGEWSVSAIRIPCSTQLAHPEINTIGALPDMLPFVEALHDLYQNPRRRRLMSRQGLRLTASERFEWKNVAARMDTVIREVVESRRTRAAMKARRRTGVLAR